MNAKNNKADVASKKQIKQQELTAVLPLRDVVVYPHMVIPLFVGRDISIKALDAAMLNDNNTDSTVEMKETEDSIITDNPVVASELIPKGEKLLATLGYLSFLCILPIVLKPKSKLCQLHGKQSMVITIVFMIFSWLTWLSGGFAILLGLAHVGIAIWGMSIAWKGKEKSMPFFGEIAAKLNW